MAKAILVLDEIPAFCRECPLEFEDEGLWQHCQFCGADPDYKIICEFGEEIDKDDKPNWCPLKEMPQKLTTASDKLDELKKNNIDPNSGWYGWITDLAYESGWNNFLNKITGEED